VKKKLVIVNGAMGVGKTTTCKELSKKLQNSVWLDGDWCWMINPFVVNEENKRMVINNINSSS
jgi:adenylate kinase family enzyme